MRLIWQLMYMLDLGFLSNDVKELLVVCDELCSVEKRVAIISLSRC